MATVQIRNLADPAYEVLKRRAQASGRSLQEYLRLILEAEAAVEPISDVLKDLRANLPAQVSMDDIVAIQRDGRER